MMAKGGVETWPARSHTVVEVLVRPITCPPHSSVVVVDTGSGHGSGETVLDRMEQLAVAVLLVPGEVPIEIGETLEKGAQIDKATIRQLATRLWIQEHQSILVTG